MKYTEFKQIRSKDIESFPMFFAFNDAQFKEGKEKLGIQENKDLLSLGAGGFIRKADREQFTIMIDKGTNALEAFLAVDSQLLDALIYELSNHEYCITGDHSETLDALGLDYEKMTESQKQILAKAKREYLTAIYPETVSVNA